MRIFRFFELVALIGNRSPNLSPRCMCVATCDYWPIEKCLILLHLLTVYWHLDESRYALHSAYMECKSLSSQSPLSLCAVRRLVLLFALREVFCVVGWLRVRLVFVGSGGTTYVLMAQVPPNPMHIHTHSTNYTHMAVERAAKPIGNTARLVYLCTRACIGHDKKPAGA